MNGRSRTTLALRMIFVGGPGRSGTSFTAARLSRLAGVAAFPDIELKFFTEQNGLLDLWLSLGPHYSPNRATTALGQFRAMTDALIEGRYGQAPLADIAPAAAWRDLFASFTSALTRQGHPGRAEAPTYRAAVHALVRDIQALAIPHVAGTPTHFVEKTPHALLEGAFLRWLFPTATRLHVMRDPRSIAWSLRSQSWGPKDLATCAAWVDSYCSAWHALPVPDRAPTLFIEDAACRPEKADTMIARRTGLVTDPSVFGGADLATLNGWTDRAAAADRDLLDTALAEWVTAFGYDPETVGRRRETDHAAVGGASTVSA